MDKSGLRRAPATAPFAASAASDGIRAGSYEWEHAGEELFTVKVIQDRRRLRGQFGWFVLPDEPCTIVGV